MTLTVKTATGNKSASVFKVRDNTNTLKTVQHASRRDATGLKDFYGNLTVGLSATFAQGSTNRSTISSAATRIVTAAPTGGVTPYAYAWTRTDGGSHVWTIGAPSSASTAFSTTVAPNAEQTATFICTVTDATGATAVSAAVTADVFNDGGGL